MRFNICKISSNMNYFVSALSRKSCESCNISNLFLRLSSLNAALKMLFLRAKNTRNEYTVILLYIISLTYEE